MTLDVQPRTHLGARFSRRTGSPSPEVPPATPAPPRMPARRNPRWIALGLVAVCLGGLLSYVIYSRVATETSVVSLTRTVYRGQTVAAADLTSVTVTGGSPLRVVPAAQMDDLVGQKAIYDLVEGSLVPPGAVSSVVVPARGRAVVGLKLVQGRAPANLLYPGSPVRLVSLPPAGGGASKDGLTDKAYLARVVDSAPAADGTAVLVNVDVPADRGPTVALLAAQDRLAVLRDADK